MTYRTRTVVALCGLAVAGGAIIGHALLPRDTAQPTAQPTVEVAPSINEARS